MFVDARDGSDQSGDGSREHPWRTVQFAAEHAGPGATVTLRTGVYRETVVPRDGQTFRPHGQEQVVVTGCDVVEAWRGGEGGVFTAAVADPVRQVFLDEEQLPKARHPDDDGDPYDTSDWAETVAERGRPAGTGSAKVAFMAGLGGKSFEGGFYTGLNGRNPFQANMGRVVRTDGDTLHCDQTNLRWHRSRPGEFDGPGRGYVTDHLNALDSPREWHSTPLTPVFAGQSARPHPRRCPKALLRAENACILGFAGVNGVEWHWERGTLHVIPPQGKTLRPGQVEARVRLYGFDCSNRQGVTIRGLTFRAASVLMDGSQDCTLEDCELTDVSPWGRYFDQRPGGDPEHYSYGNPEDGTAGVYVSGKHNAVQNCRISRGWGALVTVRGTENTVRRNVLEAANWQCREFAANVLVNGTGHRVLDNTLRQSTAMLVVMIDVDRVPTQGTLVQGNDCRDYGYVMADGGTAAVYYNGDDDTGGTEVSHNFVADNRTANQRVSCGVYFDDGAHSFRVHHNTLVGNGQTRCGLFTHRGNRDMLVHDNTFWGHRQGAWVSAVWEGQRDAATMVYRDNLSGGEGFVPVGVPGTITLDHNREHVPASEFVDVSAGDFTLKPAASGRR